MPSLPVLLFPRQSTADHSNHNTVMSDFTQHDSHSSGSSSGSSSSPSSSMDMSHSSSGTMNMIFHVSTTDPLFSASWAPSKTGQYVGTVFFLIALGFVYRFLAAYQNVLNHRWAKAEKERKVLIAGKTGSQDSGIDTKDQKEVTVVDKNEAQEGLWAGRPWRWSVDLPRSGMAVLNAGMGYLLMLGVMTMNVGYFMAVLGGIFAGELVWGRWIKGGSH